MWIMREPHKKQAQRHVVYRLVLDTLVRRPQPPMLDILQFHAEYSPKKYYHSNKWEAKYVTKAE
jgi:hypothetical protein